MNQKDIFFLGVRTYSLAIVIFNLFNSIVFLFYPKVKDWELFSYNFYGCLLFFFLSMILFSITSFLSRFLKFNSLFLLLIMIFLIEISAFIIADTSIAKLILDIVTGKNNNYIMMFYPLSVIISYVFVKVYFR